MINSGDLNNAFAGSRFINGEFFKLLSTFNFFRLRQIM